MPVFICNGLGFWRLVLAGDVTFRMSCLLDMTPAPFSMEIWEIQVVLGRLLVLTRPGQASNSCTSVWRDGSHPFIIMPGFHFTCEERLKTLW